MYIKFLKEPLFHFFIIGTLMFSAHSWLNRGVSDETATPSRLVQIRANEVLWLKEIWTRQWQREPTEAELKGLVAEYLREALLAREARELGLDEDDTIVRRRLAQKLEFLVQDTSRLAEPTEDDLRRFYVASPEQFQTEARVSFMQVYFSRERRRDAPADAKIVLAELLRVGTTERVPELGDRLLIDAEFHDVDEQTVATQFGHGFAAAVFALSPGAWHGPIESGYGLHLVRVTEVKPARQREFAEVRTQVLERWHEKRQQKDNETYFAGLLRKYDVVVDESLKPLLDPLVVVQEAGR